MDVDKVQHWDSRGHFFAAAAEAMRRILVNRAHEKRCLKRGGGWKRIDLDGLAVVEDASDEDLIAIDEALGRLAQESPPCAEVVKLRFRMLRKTGLGSVGTCRASMVQRLHWNAERSVRGNEKETPFFC